MLWTPTTLGCPPYTLGLAVDTSKQGVARLRMDAPNELTRVAESLLDSQFRLTARTKYISVYRTADGKELALNRQSKTAVRLWVARHDAPVRGVVGRLYEAGKARASSLESNTTTLNDRHPAWYLCVADIAALREFARRFKRTTTATPDRDSGRC